MIIKTNSTTIKRVFKAIASVMLIMTLVFGVAVSSDLGKSYATEKTSSHWAIKVGNEVVLYVSSKSAGDKVISNLKKCYVSSKSSSSVSYLTPVVKVVEEKTGATTSSVADQHKTYTISAAVSLLKKSGKVKVTTYEKFRWARKIQYKTVYRTSSKVRKTVSKVTQYGKYGVNTYVRTYKKINGVRVSTSMRGVVTKVRRSKVITKGTGYVSAGRGSIYSGTSGATVVKYAKQFIGNPYVFGGTSLTCGCDCSGFVMAIFKHFGFKLPRTRQTNVGVRVSKSSLRAGDLVCYSNGHMAIYIGGGKVIHALNPRLDIRVTSLYYTGNSIVACSRIFY